MSAVAAVGIQRFRDEKAECKVMLEAMAEEIRRRAEAPDEEFVEHAPGDFAKVIERVLATRQSDDPVQGRPGSTSSSAALKRRPFSASKPAMDRR